MQYLWINKNNSKKLIIIFNGWAMNETPFKHLDGSGYDILCLYDYRDLNFDLKQFNLEKYEEKYLLAWSMGVFCSRLFSDILNKFTKKIAVNGTFDIISDAYGIPERIYKITAKLLNEDSGDKFIKNMFNDGKLNPNITITRQIPELKEELIKISQLKTDKTIDFDKVIISSDDRIIPFKNQLNFWENKVEKNSIHIINSTHCPFEIYKSYREIIC